MRRVHEPLPTLEGRHVHLFFRFQGTLEYLKRLTQSRSQETMCDIFQDYRLKVPKHQGMAPDLNFPSLRANHKNLGVCQRQTKLRENNQ